MNSRLLVICLFGALLACPAATVDSRVIKQSKKHEPVPIDGRVHTPQEIARIIDGSTLVYLIEPVDNLSQLTPLPVTRAKPLEASDYERKLFSTLDDSIAAALRSADEAVSRHQLDVARARYTEAFELDTTQHMGIERIGRVFAIEHRYDSAVGYLERGLQIFPADYEIRRLLGDIYWELGDSTRAIRELTLAHILNRNEMSLEKKLQDHRANIGRPWRDWTFRPRYRVIENGLAVHVQADSTCLGYALVKALWEYEPGYAEAMLNRSPKTTSACNIIEEEEALRMLAASLPADLPLQKVVADSLAEAYVLYEIALPQDPELILSLDWPTILKIADYVERFH